MYAVLSLNALIFFCGISTILKYFILLHLKVYYAKFLKTRLDPPHSQLQKSNCEQPWHVTFYQAGWKNEMTVIFFSGEGMTKGTPFHVCTRKTFPEGNMTVSLIGSLFNLHIYFISFNSSLGYSSFKSITSYRNRTGIHTLYTQSTCPMYVHAYVYSRYLLVKMSRWKPTNL